MGKVSQTGCMVTCYKSPLIKCNDCVYQERCGVWKRIGEMQKIIMDAREMLERKDCSATCHGDDDCHVNGCRLREILDVKVQKD